jgi:hypothetical protein
MQKAADIEDTAREKAAMIRSASLAATTIPPGGNISGALFFDSANVQQSLLQVPIGNAIFEFQFPPGS